MQVQLRHAMLLYYQLVFMHDPQGSKLLRRPNALGPVSAALHFAFAVLSCPGSESGLSVVEREIQASVDICRPPPPRGGIDSADDMPCATLMG